MCLDAFVYACALHITADIIIGIKKTQTFLFHGVFFIVSIAQGCQGYVNIFQILHSSTQIRDCLGFCLFATLTGVPRKSAFALYHNNHDNIATLERHNMILLSA